MIHSKANPTKDGTATRPTPHVAQTGDPSETVRRRVGRSPRTTPGAGEGRWTGARREATGLGMEDGGAWVEGSATEGAWVGREARGVGAGREDGGSETGGRMKMEGSETGGAWVGREEGREWEAHMGVDGAGEGRWRGVRRRGLGVDGAGECMGVDACAADVLVTRTWLHHKHHCRLRRTKHGWG